MAKVDMVHVPFKGAAESMLATVAGQVHLTFFAFSTALPNAKDGKLRAIAVGGSKRNPLLPDVPSISKRCRVISPSLGPRWWRRRRCRQPSRRSFNRPWPRS